MSKLHLVFNQSLNVDMLPEVTNPKPIQSKKFSKDGLFSEQIFGPVKSNYCGCVHPIYYGKYSGSRKCPKCGVEITSSKERRKRFAKIVLPFKVLNPLFFHILTDGRSQLKKIIENILYYKKRYYIKKNDDAFNVYGIDNSIYSEYEKLLNRIEEQENSTFKENEDVKIKSTDQSLEENAPDAKKTKQEFEFNRLLSIEDLKKGLEKFDEYEFTHENSIVLEGIDGVLTYINKLIEFDDGKSSLSTLLKFIEKNIDKIVLDHVIVLPPDFRPFGKVGGEFFSDLINKTYREILNCVSLFNKLKTNKENRRDIHKHNFKNVQELVFELFKYIFDKLSKKQGLLRANILGKRIDFSGRAVIAPDPTLKLNECKIPYWMLLEILKPELVSHLVNIRHAYSVSEAHDIIDECIQSKDTKLLDIMTDFCKDKVCILNRQPTLHRLGMLGFNIKIHLGFTIKIHPMICDPYNADFDGDCMAMYVPITDLSIEDVKNKILIDNNLLSQTDLTPVPRPNQDIVLGIYVTTIDQDEPTIEYKDVKLNKGSLLFNQCLPDDYPVVKGSVDGDRLKKILSHISFRYHDQPQIIMDTFDNIKTLGFSKATSEGFTISIDDLEKSKLENHAQKLLTGDWERDLPLIESDDLVKEIFKGTDIEFYIESGARGSWDQLKQLVWTRGYVADSKNRIRTDLIRSSLVKGLTPKEFFFSSWGCRKSLLDVALSTGKSGYLTRQLIYSTSFVELGKIDDCGTEDYLEIEVAIRNVDDNKINKVKSFTLAKSLLWRYYLNEETGELVKITEKNLQSIIGKKIKLRSPIYCKGNHICHKCYGDLKNILHSNQIGIIATQAVGERTTQLVLRTFHLGGVAKTSKDKTKTKKDENEDIISGMSIANKLFHDPSVLSKKHIEPIAFVRMLYRVFGQYGAIHLIHYEIIVSSMMWSGDSLWRLLENRKNESYEWISILQIPSKSSWLLGMAFSNFKRELLNALIYNRVDEENILTSLFRL